MRPSCLDEEDPPCLFMSPEGYNRFSYTRGKGGAKVPKLNAAELLLILVLNNLTFITENLHTQEGGEGYSPLDDIKCYTLVWSEENTSGTGHFSQVY